MISFRYHLVSIVAVFLALALGIVVGTTALSGPITKDLRNQLDDAKKQRNDLAGQVKGLQGQVDDAGQFVSTYGSQLVAGKLAKKNVLLVVLPGATSGMQAGLTRQVTAAGGKVSGVVTVTKNYLDPQRANDITSLATGPNHPVGLTLTTTSNAGQLGGELLSYVLLGKGQSGDVSQVLGSFSALHMVSVDNSTVTPAAQVIVVGRGGRSSANASGNAKNAGYGVDAEAALVRALAKDGGHVVISADGADSHSCEDR